MRLRQQAPVTPIPLKVGSKVKLGGSDRWWTVQAVSENFVAVVRQAPFRPKGELMYTVLDWRNGVRGPCDLVGHGYGDGTYSEEECAEMLLSFEFDVTKHPNYIEAHRAYDAGEVADLRYYIPEDRIELEISHRSRVPLVVIDVRHKK